MYLASNLVVHYPTHPSEFVLPSVLQVSLANGFSCWFRANAMFGIIIFLYVFKACSSYKLLKGKFILAELFLLGFFATLHIA